MVRGLVGYALVGWVERNVKLSLLYILHVSTYSSVPRRGTTCLDIIDEHFYRVSQTSVTNGNYW